MLVTVEEATTVVTAEWLRHNNSALDCPEYKCLVAEHLRAIAEWKRTFDSREAWEKVLGAERAVVEHYEKHGCREDPKSARTVGT
jgi:hypothetical protein